MDDKTPALQGSCCDTPMQHLDVILRFSDHAWCSLGHRDTITPLSLKD